MGSQTGYMYMCNPLCIPMATASQTGYMYMCNPLCIPMATAVLLYLPTELPTYLLRYPSRPLHPHCLLAYLLTDLGTCPLRPNSHRRGCSCVRPWLSLCAVRAAVSKQQHSTSTA